MNKPKIVILGAGYGGIITSKSLEKLLNSGEADVTLINKHEYHYITTQLHKTVVGTAADRQIATSIPELINPSKTHFLQATVSSVDIHKQEVLLAGGDTVPYDYLLIALGFEVETYGTPGIKENAFEIRSFRSSKAIYNQIIKQFNLYKQDQDPSRLTFVVAGGGFTGVEMLGEFADGLPKLCKEHNIPFEKVKIVAIEAAPSVIPFFPKQSIEYTTEVLEKMNIELITGRKILECTPEKVVIDPNCDIPTRTLIWSCGVKGNTIVHHWGLPIERGKIAVDSYLRVKNMKNVFSLGDCSLFMKDEKNALAPTAQVALQQAPVCAKNIIASIRGESLKAFEYHHKGSVASIGLKSGVGKVGSVRLSGLIGAFMKLVIEARYLFNLGGQSLIIKQHFGVNRAPLKTAAKSKIN
ncbi:pyridine nucleotide-disulfide oxidoreductase [Bacillus sp. AFS076308]|uniref:NAD(P)/FAD-dependent oxidoreductase n=1 Tax=unclassified Bacillus (in: firmicutes) TaxID=185979 RepID=UPI000BF9CEE4|nr:MULTISPECIES: NAD(P)/FAD-dependent oxidoreductase [unclassified Bacillus (in: firmicutes)]PFN97805.1 pyridine nucleotide-disulfide oxidoreductase [Bacillus sp. AFS076308]PGV51141.1 pyridine nucleotide-disulfide oxidoreductase [Bacillus sp. AFS037270]